MYCPDCGAEYRAGFYQCSDCGVSLVHDPPSTAPRDLDATAAAVVVFESAVPGEAEMIAAALEEAGIPPTVRRSIAGGLQLGMLEGGLTPGQNLAVWVPRMAESRARELVSEFRSAEAEDAGAPETRGPPRADAGVPPRGKAVARVVLAIVLIPLGLFVLNVLVALLTGFFR